MYKYTLTLARTAKMLFSLNFHNFDVMQTLVPLKLISKPEHLSFCRRPNALSNFCQSSNHLTTYINHETSYTVHCCL